MAPSCSEQHPELFDSHGILDGKEVVGVFYFPKPAATPARKIQEIDALISHLATLKTVLSTHKIASTLAPKYTPLINWIVSYDAAAAHEREKLLEASQTLFDSTPESTTAPTRPDHEMNGHGR